MTTVGDIRERAEAEGQGHIFRFFGELDASAQARLMAQVNDLDFDEINEQRELLGGATAAHEPERFEPPELFPLERDGEHRRRAREAVERGEQALRDGRVGCVLVAGGQGSRLGFDGPKGMFRVGPVTDRTLFGWHAARLLAAREHFGHELPWYIMTSATNDAATRAYFESEDHFGLGADNVRFFQQRVIPALDTEGRVMLKAKDALFLAPNGHGGTLTAMAESGTLRDAQERGVELFSYFQVDSPLARPVDTLFLGLHLVAGAQMSSKVVAKLDADEKVGVLGLADGKLGCIEYSDLPDDLRHARDDSGELLFRAGNSANHVFDRTFVERLTADGHVLPWHLARKAMRVVDERGELVERDGVKFETFVFDALREASASVTLEIDRAHEFSPVKNADGAASPASCRREMSDLFGGWVQRAGGELPPAGPDGIAAVEIDPRFAENESQFVARMPHAPEVRDSGHLYAPAQAADLG